MRIEAREISKLFHRGEVVALDKAGISLKLGEIHGLLGENGSGKTTLIRCIAGRAKPDAGEILIDDKPTRLDPRKAIDAGIALVPQHPRLIPSLTVGEYLHLCIPRGTEESAEAINDLSRRLQVDLPLESRGSEIPSNLITAAAILGALLSRPEFLILDEPTTSFTPLETERLFALLEELAAEGMGIVLVSHKIREIHNRLDRMTLLRRGATVATSCPNEMPIEDVSRLLMGSGSDSVVRPSPPGTIDSEESVVCLKADKLGYESREGSLRDIDFELYRGEILAVSGIRENGLDSLEGILGARCSLDRGRLILEGERPYPADENALREAGIILVPSDRVSRGAALNLSVAENGAVLARRRLSRRGVLTERALAGHTAELLAEYDLEVSPRAPARTLSGGMLQRLILGRELAEAQGLAILCEPAWGLDIRSRNEIYGRIIQLKENGTGVLLLASDIDEVLEIADRLLVVYGGRINARFSRHEFDRDRIGRAMLGIGEEK